MNKFYLATAIALATSIIIDNITLAQVTNFPRSPIEERAIDEVTRYDYATWFVDYGPNGGYLSIFAKYFTRSDDTQGLNERNLYFALYRQNGKMLVVNLGIPGYPVGNLFGTCQYLETNNAGHYLVHSEWNAEANVIEFFLISRRGIASLDTWNKILTEVCTSEEGNRDRTATVYVNTTKRKKLRNILKEANPFLVIDQKLQAIELTTKP